MQANLIFDLDNLNDQIEYQHAVNGAKLAASIHDFDQYLFALLRDGQSSVEIGHMRDMLRNFIADQGLVLDEIIF